MNPDVTAVKKTKIKIKIKLRERKKSSLKNFSVSLKKSQFAITIFNGVHGSFNCY